MNCDAACLKGSGKRRTILANAAENNVSVGFHYYYTSQSASVDVQFLLHARKKSIPRPRNMNHAINLSCVACTHLFDCEIRVRQLVVDLEV